MMMMMLPLVPEVWHAVKPQGIECSLCLQGTLRPHTSLDHVDCGTVFVVIGTACCEIKASFIRATHKQPTDTKLFAYRTVTRHDCRWKRTWLAAVGWQPLAAGNRDASTLCVNVLQNMDASSGRSWRLVLPF